ncbi:hypothetical protein CXF34_10365 [Corynebacterium bovis]|nr:hypothetical protein CXF34_10365 [Corynebacterium bovis]
MSAPVPPGPPGPPGPPVPPGPPGVVAARRVCVRGVWLVPRAGVDRRDCTVVLRGVGSGSRDSLTQCW